MGVLIWSLLVIILPFVGAYAWYNSIFWLVAAILIISGIYGVISLLIIVDNDFELDEDSFDLDEDTFDREANQQYMDKVNLDDLNDRIMFMSFMNAVIISVLLNFFGIFPVAIFDIISISGGIIYSIYKAKYIAKQWNENYYEECGEPNIELLKKHITLEVRQDITSSTAILFGFFMSKISELISHVAKKLTYNKLVENSKGFKVKKEGSK